MADDEMQDSPAESKQEDMKPVGHDQVEAHGHTKKLHMTLVVIGLGLVFGVGGILIGSRFGTDSSSDNVAQTQTSEQTTQETAQEETANPLDTDYLLSYELMDEEFGTDVTVTVSGDTRTIMANALPNHNTGEFPNDDNPNSISAQDVSYSYPLTPTFTGTPVEVRTTGVAINGVKFEPGTAETFTCSTGETYRVEAIQDLTSLGLDVNNAHVQPTGEYHYHGISKLMADLYDKGQDLVHVGFAADGHLIYYSKSGAYSSSYKLGTDARTGAGCEFSISSRDVAFSTTKDGSITSDWEYNEANGDLDECNGTEVNGQYIYLITDEFPYISRCLMGEVSEAAPGVSGGGGMPPGNGPPSGMGPQ